MTLRTLFLIYAVVMTVVIVSIGFSKGARYREILREGVPTVGRVNGIDREFPRGEGRVRVRIDWSAQGRSSTLTTGWEAGPNPRYAMGSEVELIIHNGRAHFLHEAKAVGGGWLLWVGWAFIVGAPFLLLKWLGLFREPQHSTIEPYLVS